jgi:hypothetical protein
MKRVLGWVLVIIGALMELGAIVFITALLLAPNAPRDEVLPYLCIFAFMSLGTLLIVSGIFVIRNSKPLGVSEPSVKPGTVVAGYLADQADIRDYHGLAYKVLYTTEITGKNPRPSSLAVSIVVGDLDTPSHGAGEFEIAPMTGFDRFGKRLGLATEVETGDAEFDDACYVRTDCPGFVESFLANDEVRAIIRDLLATGFTEVKYAKYELTAYWLGFKPEIHDPTVAQALPLAPPQSPELTDPTAPTEAPAEAAVATTPTGGTGLAEQTAARLLTLREYWPAEEPVVDWASRLRRYTVQGLGWLFLVAYAALIFAYFRYQPMSGWEAVWPGLGLVFPVVFGGFLILTFLLLRGTSRSHYAWRRLGIGGFFLTAFGSIGLVILLNGVLDDSPSVEHRQVIVNKYTTRNRNSTTYHVECTSWRRPNQTERFTTSSVLYDSVQPGRSQMVVLTRAGRFGIEWIVYQGIDLFVNQ